MTAPRYLVITPARNEAEHLRQTIDAMAGQTLRPAKWIIVNDGSTDSTAAVIDEAAKTYPWIEGLHRTDRGFRKSGGGVMEAFYDGYRQLNDDTWDYLVKLDADLSFEPTYFASCLELFQRDPKLGIGGGTICGLQDGQLVTEAVGDPPFHVRGATKIYRRACWDNIGGLVHAPGWDTLDEVKANMLGWTTYSFPELKLQHFRHTGDADGVWKNWVKNGRANYISGYHPLFMLFKCVSRLREKPYGLVSLALWTGFVSGYFKGVQRVDDRALIKYFRGQQMRRLMMRPSLWARKKLT